MNEVEPLSLAEELLLESFLDLLQEKPDSQKKFHLICDFLDGCIRAVKANRELKKLEQQDAENKD